MDDRLSNRIQTAVIEVPIHKNIAHHPNTRVSIQLSLVKGTSSNCARSGSDATAGLLGHARAYVDIGWLLAMAFSGNF